MFKDSPGNTRKKQLKKKARKPAGQYTPGSKTPVTYPKAPAKKKRPVVKAPAGDAGSGGGYNLKPAKKIERKRKRRQRTDVKDVKGATELNRGKPERDKNVLEARIKYLRRTRKPVTTLKKELEGTGLLAKALGNAAKTTGYASTGGGPSGLAPVRKATTGSFKPRGSATVTSPNFVSAKNAKGAGRFAQDLVNFPAQAIPSLYVPAAAAVEAAQGRPERGKKLIKDIKKSDPVYNVVAAGVEAAQGDTKTAKRNLNRAKKAASEHPGFTALEVYGVKGTVGRAGGRVKKAPPRESAKLEGTKVEEKREYSRDIITRQGQQFRDKRKTRKAQKLRAKAERTVNDDDAVALRRKANRVDPTKVNPAQIRRRVDETVAATEDIRRINRAKITRDVDEAVKPAKNAAVSLVAQRIAKADKADLKAYRDEIASHFKSLPKSSKRANRQLVKAIDDVLKENTDMGKVRAAARRYEEITAPVQKKLTERGLLAEGQADKAKLIPYAVRRMGAKHDPEKGLVVKKKVYRAGSSKATRKERIAQLEQIVKYSEESAKRQESSGKYAFGQANAVHMRKVVEDARAEIKALRATKDAKGGVVQDVPLRPQVIRAHMRKNGEAEPAFLTQAPNMRGAKNFYRAADKAPSLRTARRTGEATRKGTFDAHPDTLRENAARAQGLADATDGFTNFIDEFGHRDGKTLKTFKSRKDADHAIREALADDKGRGTGELELQAVRVNPWGGSKAQLERLLDEVDSDSPTAAKAISDAIEDAVSGGDGPGEWALVPKAAADQMAKHMRVNGPGALGKGAQVVNSSFRKTVLSTSPSWLLGNVTEAAMRSALAKAGPRSYVTGKKTLKRLEQLDPEAAKQATVRSAGGGHYAMADRTRHADHTQFEDTRIEGLARGLGTFWRTPGPKQAAGAWHAWTNFVFDNMNRKIEAQFQTAMLGRNIRDSNLMDGQTLKTGQKAVEQAAQGLRNTNEQVAFGRAVDRMYGKYNKFSPEGRQLIANYTPFVAWSLNALKFVVDVLPRDHPTVTALIAASEIASEEWRKDEGLDLFIEERVPAFLQGSVPTKDGGKFRASKWTPFGAFGSPLATATGAVLPQLSGVLAAGKGEDWKGAKLRVDGKEANELQRWGFAAKAFAEATVPVLGVGQRVAKDGPSALDPFKTVSPKKKVRRRKRKGSGVTWDDGGSGVKWDDQSSGVKWDG
jgi:hypothetical protein